MDDAEGCVMATLRLLIALPLILALLCYARLFHPDLWDLIEGSDI